MKSGFELQGLDTVLDALESRLGYDGMKPVVNKALRKAGQEAEKELKKTFASFARLGTTERQVVIGNVSWADAHIPRVKVGIRRHKENEGGTRWNIEHLNEFGFTKKGRFIRPKGFGKMQEMVDEFGEIYPVVVQKELEALFR